MPDSACWVCHRQYFLPSSAMRHLKESGHDGFFSGGRLGLWAEGIRTVIERGALMIFRSRNDKFATCL